jgi:hypothetical protein
VGADFFEREGLLGEREPPPRGVVDALDDLANPGVDVSRIHPAIVPFFQDTASLELLVKSRWRFPFSLLWRIGRPVMRWIGQFVLPLDEARIVTRVHAIDTAADGRPDARAVIRSYAGGDEVFQAVAYATWRRGASRYMSAAFPLPGGHLAGILRLDPLDSDGQGRLAVALASKRRDGDDAGVWFVLGRLAIRAPLSERLEFWAPEMPGVPSELDPSAFSGTTLVGRHEQRLFGVRFAVHHYWFRPAAGRALPSKN